MSGVRGFLPSGGPGSKSERSPPAGRGKPPEQSRRTSPNKKRRARDTKKGARPEINVSRSGARRTAAAYSPTWWGSTIGDAGLNFSVRNGKRWIPGSIATAVCDLREKTSTKNTRPKERSRAISTGRLKTLLPLHLLPIDVVVSHDPQGKSHLGDGFALRCFQRLS